MRLSTQPRLPARALAVPLVGVSLLLGACGSGSKDPATGDSASEKAALKFARCMRDHGVQVPDPGPQGQIRIQAGPGSKARIDAAQKACGHYLQELARTASPAETQRLQDAALKYAQCMRSHGIDFPDPRVGAGGGVELGGPNINPHSPQFQQADKACRHFQPDGGKGRATNSGGGPAVGFSTGGGGK
jgi:hypothetical protein